MTDSSANPSEAILSHGDIIAMWPSLSVFARDIGIPYEAAKQMRRRQSIAGPHWANVVTAARARGFEQVTVELLAKLAPRRGAPRAVAMAAPA